MNQPPSPPRNRHSFRPLMFAPPQGSDALPPTQREPRQAPPMRARAESHVRLRVVPMPTVDVEYLDAQHVLDELCEEQLALSMNLACLEKAIEQAPHVQAIAIVDARYRDVAALRDALAAIHQASVERKVQRLFVTDSALGDYLRGLYAWAHAIVRALEHLAATMRTRQPDWALLRWRIEEAKNFHFDDLHAQIRADVASLAATPNAERLDDAVENLFVAAAILETRLDQRFA